MGIDVTCEVKASVDRCRDDRVEANDRQELADLRLDVRHK